MHAQEQVQQDYSSIAGAESIRPPQQFYQPEPRLLDIASGGREESEPQADVAGGGGGGDGGVGNEIMTGPPPPWVPDEDAPNCMGCQTQFTMFRRRHHCR